MEMDAVNSRGETHSPNVDMNRAVVALPELRASYSVATGIGQ
jgi:hypothetical protein